MKWSPEQIATLFAYTRWASDKTLESTAPLSSEELLRAIGGSFGSVQATLVHLYGADWVWLERWHGRSPKALPKAEELESFDALRSRWREVQDGQRALVETMTPARMDESITYVNFAGQTWTYPLGETLLHVANHGTYHRGQIATMLRQLGKTAVSTDYLRWIDAGGK
jgi:uncharacterized damage-inducible protein DinB